MKNDKDLCLNKAIIFCQQGMITFGLFAQIKLVAIQSFCTKLNI